MNYEELIERFSTQEDNHPFFCKETIESWTNPKSPSDIELSYALESADIKVNKLAIAAAREVLLDKYIDYRA